MFENNSPLVRQSNIFRHLKNYCKDNNTGIPSKFSYLSDEMVLQFKTYDDSAQFVFDVFQMYDAMCSRQLFALIGASSVLRDVAMYGETKERNKYSIHRSSGILAANGYVNQLFELELLEPYSSATGKLPESERPNYLVHLAACYFMGHHADNFRSYLDSSQTLTFDDVSIKTDKIINFGNSLFEKKELIENRREKINLRYNDTGFIHHEDGSVAMMEFDIWAEKDGSKKEYSHISESLEKLCIPVEEIIQKGLST